jgi:hypothetical protein
MKILTPLWQLGGASRIESGRDHVDFVWEDFRTRLALRIPVKIDKGPALLASDRGAESTETRAQRARAKDDAERRGRIERNEPFARLPRHLEQLRIGMTRADAERALPAAFKRDLSGGIGFTFAGDPDSTAGVVLRELFARQGSDGKATELRARYLEGPAGQGKGLTKLLAHYRSKGGAPETLPLEENRVWADLPGKQTATIVTAWQDDLTRLVARQSGSTLEVVLRDLTADPASSFAHLSRGPDKCSLGQSRDEILRAWKIAKPIEAEGALVLTPAASSSYDAVLVWFEKERAARIVARQRGTLGTPAQSAQGVRDAWSRHLAAFGWPWRQDFAGQQLQSWGSHDDHTRLRVFWQQERDGCRVFTEWKDLR